MTAESFLSFGAHRAPLQFASIAIHFPRRRTCTMSILFKRRRAPHFALLRAQDAGKNHPSVAFSRVFSFGKISINNSLKRFAVTMSIFRREVFRDFQRARRPTRKSTLSILFMSRVLARSRDCARIVVDPDHSLRAETFRGQRQNSAARAKIDQRPSRFQFARNLLEQAQRHRRGRVIARAKCRARRNDQLGGALAPRLRLSGSQSGRKASPTFEATPIVSRS